jgi:hypothetical protein
MDKLPSPAGGHRVYVLLAVVFPHDPGRDRHRLVEGVLGLAGAGRVEDALAGRNSAAKPSWPSRRTTTAPWRRPGRPDPRRRFACGRDATGRPGRRTAPPVRARGSTGQPPRRHHISPGRSGGIVTSAHYCARSPPTVPSSPHRSRITHSCVTCNWPRAKRRNFRRTRSTSPTSPRGFTPVGVSRRRERSRDVAACDRQRESSLDHPTARGQAHRIKWWWRPDQESMPRKW